MKKVIVVEKMYPAALREPQAAIYCSVSPGFLAKLRKNPPKGMPVPEYTLLGPHLVYLIQDLDRWLLESQALTRKKHEQSL